MTDVDDYHFMANISREKKRNLKLYLCSTKEQTACNNHLK